MSVREQLKSEGVIKPGTVIVHKTRKIEFIVTAFTIRNKRLVVNMVESKTMQQEITQGTFKDMTQFKENYSIEAIPSKSLALAHDSGKSVAAGHFTL